MVFVVCNKLYNLGLVVLLGWFYLRLVRFWFGKWYERGYNR